MRNVRLPVRRWHAPPAWRQVVPWTLAAVATGVVLRLPFVSLFPSADEGGLLLIARRWHGGGPELYGNLFVDRPPLLVLFWRLADAAGGVEAARWLAMVAVAVLVVCAAWAAYLVGGPRGARWAALTAAALSATPLFDVEDIIGEFLAAPLVMLSCASVLTAVRPGKESRWQIGWAFAAGVSGAAALLMKQNFVDGLVFSAVFVTVLWLTGRFSTRTALRLLLAGAAGAALPIGATVLWAAASGPGVAVLWYTLYGFRLDAAEVIATHQPASDRRRLAQLAVDSVVTGLVPWLLAYVWLARRRLRDKDAVSVALVAMLATEVVGVALGGSYWPHYLIALVPAAALAAGSMSVTQRMPAWPRGLLAFLLASTVAATVLTASGLSHRLLPFGPEKASPAVEHALVGWLRAAGRRSDTGLVAYGHPNIIEASGLRPASYPYVWSLELRTLDPQLARISKTVSGPSAPTWIVGWMHWNVWGIDRNRALRTAVAHNYHRAGKVCGIAVFLHDGVSRPRPRPPSSCRNAGGS